MTYTREYVAGKRQSERINGPPDERIGRVLNERYRIERVLGYGGMGTVYEVEHQALGKRFALKCLHKRFLDDPVLVERFKREARAASAVGSEHIVDVTDFGEMDDGTPFIVMEYLEGVELAKLIRHGRRLSVGRAARIVAQVCEALGDAHRAGVVHRDLKPENIFVVKRRDGEEFVKVLDFGISKMVGPMVPSMGENLTSTGMTMGTPHYMSPEQAQGVSKVDQRTDIYSLGVILYRILTGEVPFRAVSFPMLVVKITTADAIPMRKRFPEIPVELDAIVLRALDKRPEKRFQSMEAFRSALSEFETCDIEPTVTGISLEEAMAEAQREAGSDWPTTPESERPDRTSQSDTVASGAQPIVHVPTAHTIVEPEKTSDQEYTSGHTLTRKRDVAVLHSSKSRSPKVWIAALAVTAGVFGAGWAVLENGSSAPEISPPTTAQAPTTIRVRISASPARAEIFLDGTRYRNPAVLERPPSDRPVHVQVRVDDTVFVDETYVFSSSQDLNLQTGAVAQTEANGASASDPPASTETTPSDTAPATNVGSSSRASRPVRTERRRPQNTASDMGASRPTPNRATRPRRGDDGLLQVDW